MGERGKSCRAPRCTYFASPRAKTLPTDHPSSLLKATLPVPGVESNCYSCSTRAFQGGDCCTRTTYNTHASSPAVISSRDSALCCK